MVPLPGNVNTGDDGYGGVEKTAAEPAAVAQQPATPTAATMAQPVGVGVAVSMPTTAVIAATPVVPIMPVSMVQVDLNYADAHSTMLPIIQGQERVHFYDRMHSGMRFALGFCSTTCCCWHMAEPRSYWKISENKVEFNYPVPCWPFCCMESCVMDVVGTRYFDKSFKYTRASKCSCVHCCLCIPFCGEVVGYAPVECCNNDICGLLAWSCCCGCFGLLQRYTIGHRNAEHFSRKYGIARQEFMLRHPHAETAGALVSSAS